MQRDFTRRGLPLPDEAMARERSLWEAVNAPNLAIVKDFLRYYVATNRGKIINLVLTPLAPLRSGSLRASPVS